MRVLDRAIDGHLPSSISAGIPAERRGARRDGVRMMLVRKETRVIEHHRFYDVPRFLRPGDALVVNTSATIPAAVEVLTEQGRRLKAHFASPITDELWWLEMRTPSGDGATTPGPELGPQTVAMPGGALVQLISIDPASPRLWIGRLEGIKDFHHYLAHHGTPIRYQAGEVLPISEYQTVFANEPGSAEMPSAARPFTPELVTLLVSAGVVVLPVLLHTGVSSFEVGERPGMERYRVPPTTAALANELRRQGGRVVAVGTTVVRALESVAASDSTIHPGEGQTDLVIDSGDRVRAVDGLITGWHEANSSHLQLLEAVAGPELIGRAYQDAADVGYLWHEFGDSLLIL